MITLALYAHLAKAVKIRQMQVSVIVTVFNEEEAINALLLALLNQTRPADEVIIVDADSTDQTWPRLQKFKKEHPKFPLKIYQKAGNRSLGRNYAITQAKHSWLALTDAGCIPHQDWLAQLLQKAKQSQASVVAGYYDAKPRSAFEAAVVPYMLVMPDKVDENNFLPATRSMLLKKSVWQKLKGFNEKLTVSEDYDFAHRLVKANIKIAFTPQAKVTWLPISNIFKFFQTVSQMAEFDVLAGVVRFKAWLVFFRYVLLVWLMILLSLIHWIFALYLVLFAGFLYFGWSIWKNAHYLNRGWSYLPLLQVTADLAVMWGMIKGLIANFHNSR